jgi:hypothetical protein
VILVAEDAALIITPYCVILSAPVDR